MDPSTASYYRAILFGDSQSSRSLPPTLCKLHGWTITRFHAMGLGSIISKQSALHVAMTWMSATKEGREFTRENTTLGDLFSEPNDVAVPASEGTVDWDSLPLESKVVITAGLKSFVGNYLGRRAGWIDVRVGEEQKAFRTSQVQLAGA
jgi:hypothetical protein